MAVQKTNYASIPTIRRLPIYLYYLKKRQAQGDTIISGTVLAQDLKFEAIQVRKDLSVTGISGKPRVGYTIGELIPAIEIFLKWNKPHKAIIIGMGNLGTAIAHYPRLKENGMKILAAFDINPDKIGSEKAGIPIYSLEDLKSFIDKNSIQIALLTIPQEKALEIASLLSDTKIKAVWNFTNVRIHSHMRADVFIYQEEILLGYGVITARTE